MKDSSYWRTVLCVFIGITVAGNTGHVLLVGADHPIPAAALAAVPPLALVLITHGLTGRIGRGGGAVFWIGAVGAVAVAGGAFWISWVTLRDLTAQLLNCGPAVASVMPLIIDVTIAVASAMAVAAHRRELVHVHQEPVAQAVHARAADAVPMSVAPPSAPTIPVYAPAPVHQELVHAEASPEHVVQRSEQVVHPVMHAEAPAALNSEDVVVQAGEQVGLTPERLHLVTTPLDGVVDQTRTAVPQPPEAVHRVVEHADGSALVLPVHDAEADRLRECGVTQLPAPAVASIVALDDAGVSRNKIAEAVPAAPRTVSKVLTARRESADPDDSDEASA
ncbi:hypothetical protein A5722_15030 [Mycobacterium vulneris]|nr:hypothetical protein A5722_15030 [Mycolicibacterium vulneris]OCB66234.1 hypothetical protein A5729_12535 [Mycolicibacterium vulneris]